MECFVEGLRLIVKALKEGILKWNDMLFFDNTFEIFLLFSGVSMTDFH